MAKKRRAAKRAGCTARDAAKEKLKEFEAQPASVSPEPIDPDFVEDWMAEQGLRRGEEWEPMHAGYVKDFCDVRTKDGAEVGPCSPDGGRFMRLDGAQEIPESEVTHLRYYEQQYVRRTEDYRTAVDEDDER